MTQKQGVEKTLASYGQVIGSGATWNWGQDNVMPPPFLGWIMESWDSPLKFCGF